ncbi:MAG: nitrous oxide reductase family maturation protein NosD, partial [Candidatus Thorarchaeota archaeon]
MQSRVQEYQSPNSTRKNSKCKISNQSRPLYTVVRIIRLPSLPMIFVLVLILFYTPNLYPMNDTPVNTIHESHYLSQSEQIEHAPIIISSNEDFSSQGWPGDGSVDNPYLISGLSISAVSTCIQLSEITSHFLIEDCSFSGTRGDCYGVYLSEVSNGIIQNNEFYGCRIQFATVNDMEIKQNHIQNSQRDAIYVTGSATIKIVQNEISDSFYVGIRIEHSMGCIVSGNIITGAASGITFSDVHDSEITFDHISSCADYGLEVESGTNNMVYGNIIATLPHAIDDGQSNLWDDNQSIGNYWGQLDNTDEVIVDGNAGSKDRFPLYPIDDWWYDPLYLPIACQIPVPLGASANQNKLGWIIWSSLGWFVVHRDGISIEDKVLRGSGILYLDAAALSDG